MSHYVKVASLAALPPGKALSVQCEGKTLALFHSGGAVRAVDGECTHAGAPLCEGDVEGGVLTCPWHAATFDLETGKALTRPATLDLRSYPVRVEGDDVLVDLS